MKADSLDLRERVLKDVDDGMTCPAAARKYSVSPAWVRRLKQRRAATGEVGPQRRGPVPAWVTQAGPIREAVRRKPDATLDEHRRALNSPCPAPRWPAPCSRWG